MRAIYSMLLTPLVAAACATGGSTATTATPTAGTPEAAGAHEHHEAAPPVGGLFTAADVKFMQDMIGHHAQALEMAALAPTHGAGEHLLRLAEKIDISQRDEIGMMKQWLTERKQPLPSDHAHHAAMPGMLTPEEMAQLVAARGRDFERLFLTFMIRHHRGALEMVDTLFASPGAGQDPDIFRFVTDVAADQLDEIDQMQYLLDTMARQSRE